MEVNSNTIRPTLGAVIIAPPKGPLNRCLASLVGAVDEIVVFTWSRVQTKVAQKFDARVIQVKQKDNPGVFRQISQAALNTDWVLTLDPDEYLEPEAISFIHNLVLNAKPDVSGFWLPYAMFFYDKHLKASYPDISQLRLFRRNEVIYDGSLHGAPVARNGRICHANFKEPIISHIFVDNLYDRFCRHLLWAKLEASELSSSGTHLTDPYEIIVSAQAEFEKYFFQRAGYNDGVPGLINAVMHAWKSAAVSCLIWEDTLPRDYQLEKITDWDELSRKLKKLHKD